MKNLLVACALLLAGPASADLVWKYQSETRDFIGQGQSRTLTFTNSQFSATATSDGIQISANNGIDNFSLTLGTRRNVDGAPQPNYCYERTQRTPFRDNGRPGVDLDMNSRGCNDSMGRFRIRELVLAGNVVSSASIDVTQHCSENGGPALLSNFRINTTTSADTPFFEPVFDVTGSLSFNATGSGTGSSAPNGSAVIALGRASTLAQRNFDNGVSFSYSGALPPNITSGFWGLDFAAPGAALLGVGNYATATRYPFQTATESGLAFSYNGSGNNTLTGSFNVTAASYEPLDELPASFAASFIQNSEGNTTNRTTGQITYNASFRNGQPVPVALFKSGFETDEVVPTEVSLAYPCSAN